MSEKNSFPLLETLAGRMGCGYLSDLKYLDAAGRRTLRELIRQIPGGQNSVKEWNDALTYLTEQDPAPDAETARRTLLRELETRP